ncbi:TRAP transporter small permease subunit [Comamonadaceae bacterium M7527]|nr:TRAP transporter small permease subunit [Comamonadaceae bacterium M7527]
MSVKRQALALIDNAETLFCEVLLALFVVLLFIQILARQLFGYSIAWSEELSTYMFVWFAYLGAVVAAKKSAHNRVTFHFAFMPKIVGKALLTFRSAVGRFQLVFRLPQLRLCVQSDEPFLESPNTGRTHEVHLHDLADCLHIDVHPNSLESLRECLPWRRTTGS